MSDQKERKREEKKCDRKTPLDGKKAKKTNRKRKRFQSTIKVAPLKRDSGGRIRRGLRDSTRRKRRATCVPLNEEEDDILNRIIEQTERFDCFMYSTRRLLGEHSDSLTKLNPDKEPTVEGLLSSAATASLSGCVPRAWDLWNLMMDDNYECFATFRRMFKEKLSVIENSVWRFNLTQLWAMHRRPLPREYELKEDLIRFDIVGRDYYYNLYDIRRVHQEDPVSLFRFGVHSFQTENLVQDIEEALGTFPSCYITFLDEKHWMDKPDMLLRHCSFATVFNAFKRTRENVRGDATYWEAMRGYEVQEEMVYLLRIYMKAKAAFERFEEIYNRLMPRVLVKLALDYLGPVRIF